MPNWVRNVVNISGKEDERKRIREKLYTKEEYIVDENFEITTHVENVFDFNNVVPMPEALNVERGSATYLAIALYLNDVVLGGNLSLLESTCNTLIPNENSYRDFFLKMLVTNFSSFLEKAEKFIADGHMSRQELLDMGKRYIDNITAYGSPTWYDWSINNWGTKWNSTGAEAKINYTDNSDSYVFNTAWSAPFPVMEKIAESAAVNSDVRIVHAWADEDLGQNCGLTQYNCTPNGYTVEETCPVSGTPVAFVFAAAVQDIPTEEAISFLSLDDNDIE